MNRKISLGLTISLIAIGCAITFVLTWTVSLGIYNSKIASSEKYDGVYEKLKELDAAVRANYIGAGTINDETLQASILSGYVNGIGDKYASYMQANAYYELQQTTSGVINGTGLEAEDNGSGYLAVTQVYKNSSAESNGVKAGDVITEIDGKSLLSMTPEDGLQRLSGEIGTKISLKLVRNGEEISVTLVRQQVDIESVTEKMLENRIGFIRITAFNAKTAEQFSTALNTLTAQGAAALIIDVRQNGGGTVSSIQPMLNRLIPAAIIAYSENAYGVRKTLVETDGANYIDLPITVLADGGTASAAELFAVALKDERGAAIVGTQTYGKASIQSVISFPDGSALTLTTAKIIPSKSDSYDNVGIKPDYQVELPTGILFEYLSEQDDTQLQKAIEITTAKITQ
ncbi:MAG: S41 family peptidase [Oscillospiraceae bacterium]|nr:S41 family peptidase [Oscillospiraceae bacterium]